MSALQDLTTVDSTCSLGCTGLTNLTFYRRWLQAWLALKPGLRHDMTVMVRELPAQGKGIGLEIYAFSSDTRWLQYEQLQADIYDYALTVLPEFDLRVFQAPSGSDLRSTRLGQQD